MARKNTCNNCGGLKEEKYLNDTCCKECRSKINKDRRAQIRADKGKHPYGSGPPPNCSKCGEKKLKITRDSWCNNCRNEARNKRLMVKRRGAGIQARPIGRKPTCCKCGVIKENINSGYCLACDNELERQRRKINISNPEFVERERKKVNDRYKEDPDFNLKKRVRRLTFYSIKHGILIKKPCEVCSIDKVDAHHDDYSKPLEVRWLCRKHHNEHHKNELKTGDK